VLAVVMGVVVPVLLAAGALLGSRAGVLLPVLLFGPVAVGVYLVATGRTPRGRGFGLGLLIGWGALVVVAAGLCIAILREF
jgi:hypothetical protein